MDKVLFLLQQSLHPSFAQKTSYGGHALFLTKRATKDRPFFSQNELWKEAIIYFTFKTTKVTSSSGSLSLTQFEPSSFKYVIISSGSCSATSSNLLRTRL